MTLKEKIVKNCSTCSRIFTVRPYRSQTAQYCSQSCAVSKRMIGNQYGKGRPGSSTSFKPGQSPWNKGVKGLHFSPDTEFKKGQKAAGLPFEAGRVPWNRGIRHTQIEGEKHVLWKGDDVGYHALHGWVRRHRGRPSTCEECGKTGGSLRGYHWASVTREYKRDLNNWRRMCVSCHKNYDLDKLREAKSG